MDPAPPPTRLIDCYGCGHATVHVKGKDGNWRCTICRKMMV